MDEPNAPPPPDEPAVQASDAPAEAVTPQTSETPAAAELATVPPQADESSVATELAAVTSIVEVAPAPIEVPFVDEAANTVRRLTRQTTALAIALAVVTVVGTALAQREGAPDLAAKKPWRASSKYADCHPERFDCGGSKTGIFFHTTMDPSPWVEIDLVAPTAFSAVSVRNRSDGYQERAVPLVLEVSDDRNTWRELARRDDTFQRWAPTFEKTTARYVRLRVLRPSFLHLDSFKVHP